MHIAKIQLTANTIPTDLAEHNELIDLLLSSWRSRGQVLGKEFPIALINNTYQLLLMVPDAVALEPQHNNQYANSALAKLSVAGFQPPQIKIHEAPDSSPACNCDRRSYLILYTYFVSLESCLRCGDCFHPVPLYHIPWQESTPQKSALHDRLMSWQTNYQACDHLQMNCVVGERFGLGEMARPKSKLSQQGRAICQDIALVMDTPTYYYLHRYRGRSQAQEKQRLCPSCDGKWLLAEQQHRLFDFQCDQCHLLSNIAKSFS
jgi:predicted  nucleic acid-binding Zn ribbon protein